MLNKRLFIITIILIALSFASSGVCGIKYISLQEFGIRISAKNFYSRVGTKATGTVTDMNKAQYIFSSNAYKGNKVEVTNLGGGKLNVKNISTGETITLDVTVSSSE